MAMKKFVVVSSSGEIQEEHVCPEAPATSSGRRVVEVDMGFEPTEHWHSGVEFELKATYSLTVSAHTLTADGVDECIITGIPAGITVIWPDGQIDEVTDGEVRFAVDLPGTYTLIFDAVPYHRQEVTIEAVAAT